MKYFTKRVWYAYVPQQSRFKQTAMAKSSIDRRQVALVRGCSDFLYRNSTLNQLVDDSRIVMGQLRILLCSSHGIYLHRMQAGIYRIVCLFCLRQQLNMSSTQCCNYSSSILLLYFNFLSTNSLKKSIVVRKYFIYILILQIQYYQYLNNFTVGYLSKKVSVIKQVLDYNYLSWRLPYMLHLTLPPLRTARTFTNTFS